MNWSKGKTFISLDKTFCENSKYANDLIKSYINKHNLIEYKCKECGCIDWNNKPLKLELHHINGISNDNRVKKLIEK